MKQIDVTQVKEILRKGGSARLAHQSQPRFKVNDAVTTKCVKPFGHIRLPEYVQGHCGVVHKLQGSFIFADAHAAGHKEAQYLYSVRFDSKELWGSHHPDSPSAIYVDLFESYLEPK